MDGVSRIIVLAHATLRANSVAEAERAFAALAHEDLQAAKALAYILIRATPHSASLWAAILNRAWDQEVERNATSMQATKPKSFRWSARDPLDTADELAARMGWRDMERRA